MKYRLLTDQNDALIPEILSVYKLPSVARFISIDETNYWKYATGTDNVGFYKIFEDDCLTSTIHLELDNRILYMSVVVFPKYQKKGIATKIIQDIQKGKFGMDFNRIQVSVDENNIASIKLFENAGFVSISEEKEPLEYEYIKS